MGQRAYYSLFLMKPDKDHRIGDEKSEKIIGELINENQNAADAIGLDGLTTGEDLSWPEMEQEMKAFSKKHPEIRFNVYEEGSSFDGKCNYYFVNGKMQECWGETVFPKYSRSKLKV